MCSSSTWSWIPWLITSLVKTWFLSLPGSQWTQTERHGWGSLMFWETHVLRCSQLNSFMALKLWKLITSSLVKTWSLPPSLPQYTNWETWVRLMMFWETQCSQMSLAEFMALKLSRLITSLLKTWFLNMVPSSHHQRQTERPHGWDSWCFEGLVFSDDLSCMFSPPPPPPAVAVVLHLCGTRMSADECSSSS